MIQKKEKGSIVLFVTITCLFILIILAVSYVNLQGRKSEQDKQISDIVDEYEVTYEDMEKTYYKAVNNNANGDNEDNAPVTEVAQLKQGDYVKYLNAVQKEEKCIVLYGGNTESIQIMQLSLVPVDANRESSVLGMRL